MSKMQLLGRLIIGAQAALAVALLAVFMNKGGACQRSVIEEPIGDTPGYTTVFVLGITVLVLGILIPLGLLRRRLSGIRC